ncbi:FAD dependent oxidoreductase domain-containing protein [Xylaria cf. heliscus]|nr:FAD dependent oxidoreductase domain-containing protein [Xylaria cf. heliscus]
MEPLKRDSPFRVVIVGAGVSGLTLAHSFEKANIDYVVLDKHPVAPAWGASITIHPLGARILHQLGLLDAFDKQCTPMHNMWNRGPDGKNYNCEPFFDQLTKRNGYLSYTLSRQNFLKTLYDALPDKTKIIENARLVDASETNGKVKVQLADGSVHEGDLLVGADGVHSAVRSLVWKHANQAIPGSISLEEKQRIKTTYNCLLGTGPLIPGLGSEDMHCVSFDKFSFLILTQPDSVFFIAHCKLPNNQVIMYPSRAQYTAEDVEAKAAELADCPITETVKFGDIWRSRSRGHLVSLEEGILERWFSGRMVLCGDAAHKFTPNAALGGSMAMESAVSLANALHEALSLHPNKKPTDTEMRVALQKYQDFRIPRLKFGFTISWVLTRAQAYDGFAMYMMQRWIIPAIGLDTVAGQASKFFSEAPKLNYIHFDEKRGTLPWKDYSVQKKKKPYNKSQWVFSGSIFISLLASTLALFSLANWMLSSRVHVFH